MDAFDLESLTRSELTPESCRIWEQVREFTMTGAKRIDALIKIVNHISRCQIAGAMVECGVWRGGSIMAMALSLQHQGENDRSIYLYDTFAGMSSPGIADVSIKGTVAIDRFAQSEVSNLGVHWCLSPLHEVQSNIHRTQYPPDKFHFIQGRLEDTLPINRPSSISLLRLDTDWFESTRHALIHLYPLLVPGGFLIVDDYGHWEGAKKAVDEYFILNPPRPIFKAIDYSCIVGNRGA